ncbi:Uu.00g142650.m01.CDS01 [Anthostomella pinea]|uniref:Uu.00g142650.m01.CDS01 n=1 Tax=Anthostomella pinea TaxID=933095 RepID=A0AAI8VRB5_9PEZI|nr:Uu.00g142650.m01.CDS01 [Anthostomella pinea]
MPLKLEEVRDEQDFDQISPMLYAAFGQPYNSLRRWFMPVHTTVEAAIEASKQRAIKNWKAHENLHWVKVTDPESGQIIGAAEWEIREQVDNTNEPQQPINARWHIEGSEEKEFTGKLLTSLKGFMKERMTRPHLELEQLVVHPDHRNQGAGRMLTEWGIQKGDELGLESCVEAVLSAVPIYEKLGYGNVDGLDPDVSVANPSKKWQEYAADDLRVALMWRPACHNYREGTDRAPWLSV